MVNTENKIIDYISKDELMNAINLTLNITKAVNKKVYWDAIILSMELYYLKNAVQGGRILWEQEHLIKNQIAYKILKIVDQCMILKSAN